MAPPGVSVRCAHCGNLSATPGLAPTVPVPRALPVALAPSPPVMGPSVKGAASPPPVMPGQSQAGGWGDVIGGGSVLFGIGLVKALVLLAFSVAGCLVWGLVQFLLLR